MERDLLLENGLPSNLEAEKAVLGAITLNNRLLLQASSMLEKADFLLDSHRLIFDAMICLNESGNPIDSVTLPALLRERKELENVGGVSYLASLVDGVPQTDTIEHYCRIVKFKAREREAISHLHHAVSEIYDGEDTLGTILHRVGSRLAKICNDTRGISGVYATLNALFSAEFDEPEEILFGLHRGEVAGLLAITNYGKSTLLCNVGLAIASGESCSPLAPIVSSPRRVLYVDSESPAPRARQDLQMMIHNVSNAQAARENFITVVDAEIDGHPLNLSLPNHFDHVVALAKEHKVDLVIIDTAASAFELRDENSNAEVTRQIMIPLKRLAREGNCAVIFTHHIGKSNETQTGEAAYRGRGASAFGALSRTVFTIERDAKKGPGYVVLRCAKIKGQPFEVVLLRLNRDMRWFEICDEGPEAKPAPPTAEEIADFVAERQEASTDEIKGHFAVRASSRTVDDRIKEAKKIGLIWKRNQQAPWRVCNLTNDDSLLRAQEASESTDNASLQVRKPYKGLQTAHSRPTGGSNRELATCPGCGAQGLVNSHCDRCGEFLRDADD